MNIQDIKKQLEKAVMPKVVFYDNMESMQSEAIDNMKLHIYAAIEMLKSIEDDLLVEDKDIERIVVEGVRWFESPGNGATPGSSNPPGWRNFINKPPMKMILEIPKD